MKQPQLIPLSYYDIVKACEQPGCPLCQLVERFVRRYLETFRTLHDGRAARRRR